MRIIPKGGERTLSGAVLGFANGFAAFCDWLEDIERGAEPIRAAEKAYKKARRRTRALKRSERVAEIGKEVRSRSRERDDNVIDVTPEVERRRASR